MTPQFWERPLMPNVWATSDGRTPKRKPYAIPVRPETITNVLGLDIIAPANWVAVNTTAEMNRHQNRDMFNFLTSRSDPMPEKRIRWSVDDRYCRRSTIHTTRKAANKVPA